MLTRSKTQNKKQLHRSFEKGLYLNGMYSIHELMTIIATHLKKPLASATSNVA